MAQAIRTLKLLEQHHEKLAQLLKFQDSHPVVQGPETAPEARPISQPPATPTSPKVSDVSSRRSLQPSPLSGHAPQRELSSTIANNLASARGIPSNRQRRGAQVLPPTSPQHAEGRVLNPTRKSNAADPGPRKVSTLASENIAGVHQTNTPPVYAAGQEDSVATRAEQKVLPASSRSDEPFQRFYATFEGLLSKLSAPLAFAGLPLGLEEAIKPDQPERPKVEGRTSIEPDVTKVFSKAALRAIREEHGQGSGGFGGAESFYVVPTTGGTISYADILARAHQEARQGTENEDQMDEFVDARETPQPVSPGRNRRPKAGTKTLEELQLENEALRALADHLSRRLQEFEMGAQTSSMALHRSIRAIQSPATSDAGGGGREERLSALEEQMALTSKEMASMRRENEKLKGVVARYRERWEKLKEGARVRREGTGKDEIGDEDVRERRWIAG